MNLYSLQEVFLLAGRMLANSFPLSGKGSVVMSAKLRSGLYFVKMDWGAQKIFKVTATCEAHAFHEDDQLHYAVEKRGRFMSVFDFNNPSFNKRIAAPDDIRFYGHCTTFKNDLYVTGVRFDQDDNEYARQNVEANNLPGVLLVYDKKSLKLKQTVFNVGFGPHEVIIHQNQILVATCKGSKDRSSMMTLDPATFKIVDEYFILKKNRIYTFATSSKKVIKSSLFWRQKKGGLITNIGLGTFNKDNSLTVNEFSNEKEKSKDYDHTTAFSHGNTLYIVLYNINKIFIQNERTKLVELPAGDFEQLKAVTDICMDKKNGFIFQDPDFKSGNFLIRSHMLISNYSTT